MKKVTEIILTIFRMVSSSQQPLALYTLTHWEHSGNYWRTQTMEILNAVET